MEPMETFIKKWKPDNLGGKIVHNILDMLSPAKTKEEASELISLIFAGEETMDEFRNDYLHLISFHDRSSDDWEDEEVNLKLSQTMDRLEEASSSPSTSSASPRQDFTPRSRTQKSRTPSSRAPREPSPLTPKELQNYIEVDLKQLRDVIRNVNDMDKLKQIQSNLRRIFAIARKK